LGLLQFALYAHALDVLNGAVQEGARLAAEDGRSLADGYQRVGDVASAGLGATVEPIQPRGLASDDEVRMVVDVRLRPILPLPIVDAFPLHAEARVSRERFRPGGGAR
jgi:hypothetical protein